MRWRAYGAFACVCLGLMIVFRAREFADVLFGGFIAGFMGLGIWIMLLGASAPPEESSDSMPLDLER